MTDEYLAVLFRAVPWTFAKTMPHIPHFWTAKQDWEDREQFTEICHYIVTHGRMERFKTFKPKPYLYVNGWRYWIMNEPHEAKVINRCDPKHPKLAPHIKVA